MEVETAGSKVNFTSKVALFCDDIPSSGEELVGLKDRVSELLVITTAIA